MNVLLIHSSRRSKQFFVALALLTNCQAPCCVGAELPEIERHQPSPFRVEDRFRTDTSQNYKLKGDVKWSSLEVKLPSDSYLGYVKALDGSFQSEFDLWPGELKQGVRSRTRVHLQCSNQWHTVIAILRANKDGKIYRQVVISEVKGSGPGKEPVVTELRRTPAFTFPGGVERWTIQYHYGLVELRCGGKSVCTAYTSAFSSWLNGVAISQEGHSVTVTRFMLSGKTTGYSTQQRELYNKTQVLRLKASEAANQGELAKAVEIERSILPYAEKCNGKNHFINGIFHQTIADRLGTLGVNHESKVAHEVSAELFRAHLGAGHPETLQAEMYVAEKAVAEGELKNGAAAMRNSVLKYVRIAGTKGRNSRSMLTRLAQVLRAQANEFLKNHEYDEYHRQLAEVFAISKKAYGKDHWLVKNAGLNLAFAKRLANAEGKELVKLQQYLSVSAEVFPWGGQTNHAVNTQRQDHLLSLTREIHGSSHPQVADALIAISIDRFNRGDVDVSIRMLREAVDIYHLISEGDDPRYINALGKLGSQMSMLQRHSEASELLSQACILLKENGYGRSIEYADMLLEYGRHLIRIGDRNQAGEHLLEAFQLYRALGQPAHPNAFKTCERIADIHRANGNLKEAEKVLKYHRNLVLATHGKETSHYIDILTSEARHLYMRKKNEKAVKKYNDALALVMKIYGKKSRSYEAVVNGLIDVHLARGDGPAVVKYFEERLAFELSRREALFNVYSEQEQFIRSQQDLYALDALILLALEGHMESDQAYNHALAYKGAVTAWQRVARIAHRDPEIQKQHSKLAEMERQLVEMPEQGLDQSQKLLRKQLTTESNRLRMQLLSSSHLYQKASQRTQVKDIQNLLPEDTALVDYYEYNKPKSFLDNLFGQRAKAGLVAFVLTKEEGVQLIDLGAVGPAFEEWDAWRQAMDIEPFYELASDEKDLADVISEHGNLLRKRIWDPLVKHLSSADTVIVSPSVHLSACPFAALPSTDGKSYLIEEYAFAYFTTPRLLPELLVERDSPASTKLLLVGDIDYRGTGKSEKNSPQVASNRIANGFFRKLPQASQALRPILSAHFKRFKSTNFKQLRGKQASEQLFREHLTDASYIHLHTHGFCLPLFELSNLRGQQASSSVDGFSPLLSGIALAGGDQGIMSTSPSQTDGILWSKEIEELDLSQAELVTLSACQTAIGNVVAGEGMLGAQRALHVAGARSSLTALWAVNDLTTRALMQEFYRQLWKEEQPRAKALQQAMIYMLREYPWQESLDIGPDSSLRIPPAFWAGFVLHGDWR